MLSRTANGLFWMSRYVERASNLARLLDAGRRMDNIPNSDEGRASEWESILIASGCLESYPGDISQANMESVTDHVIFDQDNPSSISCCMRAARENARAMRIAVTTEVWDVVNTNWADMRVQTQADTAGGKLAGFLDWVKSSGFTFQGAVEASMLRDEGCHFISLGRAVERADATARLLDVKYHVLLPDSQNVGGGLDHMQWVQLLRATNSLRAFRWTYREAVTPHAVVHFLVLNPVSPRSIVSSINDIVNGLDAIGGETDAQRSVAARARTMLTRLQSLSIEQIISHGLHEWLTSQIADVNVLAGEIAEAYGFNGPEDDAAQQSQSQ